MMKDRLVNEVANQPLGDANHAISPPVRQAVIRLQDVADGADLRANMLEWMIDSFPIGDLGPTRVKTLREGAARLRNTASHLVSSVPFGELEAADSA